MARADGLEPTPRRDRRYSNQLNYRYSHLSVFFHWLLAVVVTVRTADILRVRQTLYQLS